MTKQHLPKALATSADERSFPSDCSGPVFLFIHSFAVPLFCWFCTITAVLLHFQQFHMLSPSGFASKNIVLFCLGHQVFPLFCKMSSVPRECDTLSHVFSTAGRQNNSQVSLSSWPFLLLSPDLSILSCSCLN